MAVDWENLDYDDPCALLAVLRPAYYQLLAGQRVVETQHGETRSRFEQGDVTALKALIADLTSQCQAANGGTGRRVLIAG